MNFDYAEMTRRNIGFVSSAQQEALHGASVFVCGAGGMGGACLQTLVRAGVGNFEIADFDRFEVSNLNRQAFATMETMNQLKAMTAAMRMSEINPEVRVRVHATEWMSRIRSILMSTDVVVNAMDDVLATIRLYREAAVMGLSVIDAYTSTLPSVYVTRPRDPRPEERMSFPTFGVPLEAITTDMLEKSRLLEIEYVIANSSTAAHVDLEVMSEVITGRRPRISFAPMVSVTGNLMAYEAIALITGAPSPADAHGYFFNPYCARIERPGLARTQGGAA